MGQADIVVYNDTLEHDEFVTVDGVWQRLGTVGSGTLPSRRRVSVRAPQLPRSFWPW